MKVLTMQLNSITIMDLIAYGGAALGVILAVSRYAGGKVSLIGALLIILLAADFFLPMRLLGSYFHIAMNGMAASDKIFRLLDLPEPKQGTETIEAADCAILCREVRFGYEAGREILHGVDLDLPMGSFTALVGESGCGKSTLAALLMGRNRGYTGRVTVGGVDLAEIAESSRMQNFTYISHQSYLFKGTVRENLCMAKPDATDAELWGVLEKANLADFVRGERGLDTPLDAQGANLSGGQRQRLALARALLHDSPVYIFDEATSNIDVESENAIMAQVYALANSGTKTVLLISHRLANVTGADQIYVLESGRVAESGTHAELLRANGSYAALWNAQQQLEQFGIQNGTANGEGETV
jgi:ABC-type transport system involved in cytochrome bd biosynthesis fused ATPase/permease subunit